MKALLFYSYHHFVFTPWSCSGLCLTLHFWLRRWQCGRHTLSAVSIPSSSALGRTLLHAVLWRLTVEFVPLVHSTLPSVFWEEQGWASSLCPLWPLACRETFVIFCFKISGLTHIITMDLHQKEIQGFFCFPVDNLRASPFLLQYIQEEVRSQQHTHVSSNTRS